MAIKKNSKSVKDELNKLWQEAPDSGANIVEGTYRFKIETAKYHETEKVVGIKSQMKVIAGAEEYIGEVINQFDNLTTQQNMSFFKQKLQKLGIALPSDFSDIEDGTIPSEMEGLCFEGNVKVKEGFVNIYVTRLVEDDEEEETEETEEEDSEEAEEVEETSEEENDEEESEEEEETEKEEDTEEESEGFPEPEEVASLKMSEIKKILKDQLGVDVQNVVYTKKALETISKYIYVKGFKPDPIATKETMKMFKLKVTKDPIANRKALKKHINDLIG